MLAKLSNQDKLIKYKWLTFEGSGKNKFDFRHYDSLKELFKSLCYKKLSIEDAEIDQGRIMFEINRLDKYKPNKTEYVTARKNLLINAENFYNGRQMIIDAFKNGIFSTDPNIKTPSSLSSYEDREYSPDSDEDYTPKRDKSPDKTFDFSNNDLDDLLINIVNELDHDVIKKYFYYHSLRDLQSLLKRSGKNKRLYREQINLIKGALKF